MARISGYGYQPTERPPFGRRKWAFAGVDPAEPPTDDWSSLIASGYTVVCADLYDGIPYVVAERRMLTVTGAEALPPTDDYTISYALSIMQGDATSCEMDRKSGVSGGRALNLLWRRQSIEDEGLGPLLFKDPSTTAVLTSAVETEDVTTFEVDDASTWAESGVAYIGRECFAYTSTSPTSFDGIRRAIAGLPHYHTANGSSGYSTITDVPQYWRGRFVTRYEHLCGPDGRFLGSQWCALGTYCRQRWKGQVDSEPTETPLGKVMRALPIVRLAGQEIGSKFSFDVAGDGAANPLLWFNATDVIRVHGSTSTTVGQGPTAANLGEFATLDSWCSKAAADITTAIGSSNIILSITAPGRPANDLIVSFYFPGGTTSNAGVTSTAWFLRPGNFGASGTASALSSVVRIPIDFDAAPTAWLVLRATPSEDFAAADVPSAGTAIIESQGLRERVRWDAKKTVNTAAQADLVGLRLVERQVDGTPRTNPWRWGGKVTIVAGATGSWPDTFRTIMTSSGTGSRGDYDTLPFGFGAGLPDEWLDAETFEDAAIAGLQVSAVADERRSLEDVLGGWLALTSRCIVQRRNAAGEIVLAVVSTTVTDNPFADTLGAADVLLEGHGTPEPVESPNTIKCEIGGLDESAQPVIYRDVARVQAEGQRLWTLRAPGATDDTIAEFAPGIISRTHGQATVGLEAPPSCELQPGDPVVLTTAHPTVYDWSTGTYAPASINALVHTLGHDEWTCRRSLVLLLQGRGSSTGLLCPAARVIRAVSSIELEVVGGEDRFVVNDAVRIYEPGNESTNSATAVVTSIDGIEHTITFDAVPAFALATPGKAWVGFDTYTAAANSQADFMFIRTDKRWS